MGKRIFDVANYFLKSADINNDEITHLKLQKLCYYAQAWHLAIHDKPLFDEEFEAWVHGPANYELYKEYRKYGFKPIKYKSNKKHSLSKEQTSLLDEIWEKYGSLDAKVLENLTHSEPPWIESRNGISEYQNSNAVIEHSKIKEYFKKLINKRTLA